MTITLFIFGYIFIATIIIIILYKAGFMKAVCEPDSWGDEISPFGFIFITFLFWYGMIIIIPLSILIEKINQFFYEKF